MHERERERESAAANNSLGAEARRISSKVMAAFKSGEMSPVPETAIKRDFIQGEKSVVLRETWSAPDAIDASTGE